ncbi:MAG TPA: hypothetical protein VI319_10695 [Burkholderiales bacterium]
MYSFTRSRQLIAVWLLFGLPALIPASSDAAQRQAGLSQVALSLERTIPTLVSSQDYRSASSTAFLLATARSRLDDSAAACAALSQSLEYYRMAIAQDLGGRFDGRGRGIDEGSDGMAVIRAKFGCDRPHSA